MNILGIPRIFIEVSRFYERLPKPYAIAIQEWLDSKIYYRDTDEETEDK